MSDTLNQMNNNDDDIFLSPRCSHIEYDMNRTKKEKDIFISQLKAKIFELELHQKNYDLLYERYKQLENEFLSLNDCTHQLEYEKLRREEEINKHVIDLQSEKENLQINFNEKLITNKNIYAENNFLGKEIESKDLEILNLKSNIKNLESKLSQNYYEIKNLKNIVNDLSNITNSHKIKINKLIEDNKTLSQVCQVGDIDNKVGEHEKGKMVEEINYKNNVIQDLNCEIRCQINDLKEMNMLYNRNNCENLKLESNIKNCEQQNTVLKSENEKLKNNIIEEKSKRIEKNQQNCELNKILNEREEKINEIYHDIEIIKNAQDNASYRNNILHEENEKLKQHILTLTELNQILNNEINYVIKEDTKMSSILNRKERISNVLNCNRNTIDESLNCLDQYFNKVKCPYCKKSSLHICEDH